VRFSDLGIERSEFLIIEENEFSVELWLYLYEIRKIEGIEIFWGKSAAQNE
jgi:hypothetical protein